MAASVALVISSGCSDGAETSAGGFTSLPPVTATMAMSGTTDDPSTTGEASSTSAADTTGVDPTTGLDPTTSSTSSTTTTTDATTSAEGSSSTGAPPPGCGNAVIDPLEECDDGNDDDTDECTSMCASATCGDGFIQAGVETCDDKAETMTCNADCTAAMCGDKVVNAAAGETCDDGMESPTCNTDCTAALCGDSIVNAAAGEACDDGNMVDTDACVAGCIAAKCGDKLVQAGVEDCDDGNIVNGDGCENNCKKSPLPAECLNPMQLSEAFRNVTNQNGPVGCDNPFTTGWYRFTGAAGVRMPTVAPPTSACGTHATGWLNGAQPSVQDGAVDRQICFHWSGNPCNWSEPAKVRNCGDYYVYYLKNVAWGCSGRYCGTN